MASNSTFRRDNETTAISRRPVSGTFHIGHRVLDAAIAPVIENTEAGPVRVDSMASESRGIYASVGEVSEKFPATTQSKVRGRAIEAVSQIAIHAAMECRLSAADIGSCWDMTGRGAAKVLAGEKPLQVAYLMMMPGDWQRFAVLVVAGIVRTWQPASRTMLVGLIGGMG